MTSRFKNESKKEDEEGGNESNHTIKKNENIFDHGTESHNVFRLGCRTLNPILLSLGVRTTPPARTPMPSSGGGKEGRVKVGQGERIK